MRARHPAILLVEDNDLDAEKIVRAFARLGITRPLRRARDGLEGLATLRGGLRGRADASLAERDEIGTDLAAHPPIDGTRTDPTRRAALDHVVLLDLNMPRMNGLEFLEELRSDSLISTTPVFVLTTSGRQKDIVAAHRHHVAGYLVKPPTMLEMLETLQVASRFWDLCCLPREVA